MTLRIVAAGFAIALLAAPTALAANTSTELVVAQADTGASQYLSDTRSLDSMSDQELRQRIRAGRKLMDGSLAAGDMKKVRQAVRAASQELRSRNKDEGGNDAAGNAATAQDNQGGSASATQSGQQQAQQQNAGQKSVQNDDLADLLADKRALGSIPKKELRQKIRVGRKLLQGGSLSQADRQQVQQIVQAARKAMQDQGGEDGNAGAEESAGNAGGGNTGNNDASGKQGGAKATGGAADFLADSRPLDQLSEKELRQRMRAGRLLMKGGSLSQADRQRVQQVVRAARLEFAKRGGKGGQDTEAADQNEGGQSTSTEAGNTGASTDVMADNRDAKSLDDDALRKRLRAKRDALGSGKLSPAESKALRQKLAQDRRELRMRIAKKTGRGEQDLGNQASVDWLQDRRDAKALKDRELEGRMAFYRARLAKGDLSTEQKAQFQIILDRDRNEFRSRAIAMRGERVQKLKRRLASKEINIRIDIDVPGQPVGRLPPPIWAAEADDDAIVVQLTRRPARKFARRYTFQEVATEPDVREAMPAVEIDTVTFGFNEDWVREEQLENLDRIGTILEEIIAAHPHEVFMIEGHTDAVGTDEYNLDLSRRRALAIKQALTQYYEIRPENLETIGYGEEHLKIQTEDPEEENRRISIRRITPAVGELE